VQVECAQIIYKQQNPIAVDYFLEFILFVDAILTHKLQQTLDENLRHVWIYI